MTEKLNRRRGSEIKNSQVIVIPYKRVVDAVRKIERIPISAGSGVVITPESHHFNRATWWCIVILIIMVKYSQ